MHIFTADIVFFIVKYDDTTKKLSYRQTVFPLILKDTFINIANRGKIFLGKKKKNPLIREDFLSLVLCADIKNMSE